MGLEIERRSIAIYNTELRSSLIRSSYASFAVSDLHFATVYGLKTDLEGCKIRAGGCYKLPLAVSSRCIGDSSTILAKN